jgi:hypothetical protein
MRRRRSPWWRRAPSCTTCRASSGSPAACASARIWSCRWTTSCAQRVQFQACRGHRPGRRRPRRVHTSAGDVANDALVIATGGRFLKKLPGIEHAITPCEGIAAAERIRDRLREMQGGSIAVGFAGNPNEPTAVRGGPMFEFLFGIDEQLGAKGGASASSWSSSAPPHQPGNRLGPKAVAPAGRNGPARHPHPPGPQDQALRGRPRWSPRAASSPPT